MRTAIASQPFAPSSFLGRVLVADATACGAMGLLLVLGAGPLSGLLGLPVALLVVVGAVLVPLAALMAYVGTRPAIPRGLAWGLVAFDLLWVVESFGLLLLGWVEPTGLGTGFVIGQALVVLAFAELKYLGLRR